MESYMLYPTAFHGPGYLCDGAAETLVRHKCMVKPPMAGAHPTAQTQTQARRRTLLGYGNPV